MYELCGEPENWTNTNDDHSTRQTNIESIGKNYAMGNLSRSSHNLHMCDCRADTTAGGGGGCGAAK